MKPLAPNTMIQNRYLVVQAIGKGGMGEVYLAVDQRLGSAVALKRTFFNDDNILGSAFEREARILARLRHPVLPKVIDHFAENGDQFLVMEHISGDDISKRLESGNKPFPLSWVIFWADQMLDALSYLHSHEPPIVHRDIKPQNLKLTDENHIVILDFGLSKDFDTSTTGNPLNSASVAGYSPHFASMEQIRGTGTDARSDIYSLSATLYQMLTNSIPIDALSRADARLGGGKDPIQPLNEINPEVNPAISEVILKGMELRQDERFPTASEMQKALRRAFNKGTSPVDPKSLAPLGSSEAATTPPAEASLPSEMATRTQGDLLVSTNEYSLDSTLHMESIPSVPQTVPPVESNQSDIKTEVFSAPVVPAAPVTVPDIPVEAEIDHEPEEATRLSSPKISIDLATAASAGAAATVPPSFEPPVAATQPPAVQPQPLAAVPAEKKSKAGLVAGVVIGLLVIGSIVAAGGWFAYTKYSAAAKPAATPTPAPVASATPAPTETGLAGTDTNSNSNSNVAGTTESNTDVTGPSKTPLPTSQGPSTKQPMQAPPPPVSSRTAPPKVTAPPAVKATPKAKQPDERSKILQ